MEFWSAVVVLAYFLAGITRLNGDIRNGGLDEPSFGRDRRIGMAFLVVLTWPLYRGLAGIFLSLIIAILVTALLMWVVGALVALVWQTTIVASIYVFFMFYNFYLIER